MHHVCVYVTCHWTTMYCHVNSSSWARRKN